MPCYDPRPTCSYPNHDHSYYYNHDSELQNTIDSNSKTLDTFRKKQKELIQLTLDLKKSVMFSNAVACAMFKVLESIKDTKDILHFVDYEEAGFTKEELENWLRMHTEYDNKRKEV